MIAQLCQVQAQTMHASLEFIFLRGTRPHKWAQACDWSSRSYDTNKVLAIMQNPNLSDSSSEIEVSIKSTNALTSNTTNTLEMFTALQTKSSTEETPTSRGEGIESVNWPKWLACPKYR